MWNMLTFFHQFVFGVVWRQFYPFLKQQWGAELHLQCQTGSRIICVLISARIRVVVHTWPPICITSVSSPLYDSHMLFGNSTPPPIHPQHISLPISCQVNWTRPFCRPIRIRFLKQFSWHTSIVQVDWLGWEVRVWICNVLNFLIRFFFFMFK